MGREDNEKFLFWLGKSMNKPPYRARCGRFLPSLLFPSNKSIYFRLFSFILFKNQLCLEVNKMAWDDDNTIFTVVINHEEQYSIWPVDRETPLGWKTVGKEGSKQECLNYIEEVWTDMRPLSLRKKMEDME